LGVAAVVLACNPLLEKGDETGHTTSQEALANSTFEIDGNLVAETGTDWANIAGVKVGVDKPTGQSDDSFGNGSKENSPVPSVVSGAIPNNKSDLTRFYVASEHANGQDFLYLAWERANTLGTANMDFEFNQSSTPSANGVTPVRTAGDILITFDFSSGGNQINLGILSWQTAPPAPGKTGCFAGLNPDGSSKIGGSPPCWGNRVDLAASGAAQGSVNSAAVLDPLSGANLAPDTFGEAAINLGLAGVLDPNACRSFGRAFLKSRSSDSFTAEMKDFIAPIPVEVNNCQPVTIQLKKVDTTGAPLPNAVLQLFKDQNNDGTLDAPDTQEGANCTTGVDGIGNCSFQVTTNGRYIGHELTPPNGYSGAADQTTTVTMTSQPQTITLTFVDAVVPGRIDVYKKDEASNPVAGATFTLYADAAPTGGSPGSEDKTSLGTCTTVINQGVARCSFTNLGLGDYWVVETTTPLGYSPPAVTYQHVTVGLGNAPNVGQTESVTFINKRAFKIVVYVCQTDGTLHPSTVNVDSLGDQLSLSAADAQSAGLDPSALCDVTQGAFAPRPSGDHTSTITIP
jgi:hypothetical protein